MANTGTDALIPEFWAAAFDPTLMGEYNLQNLVSRNYESQIANVGNTVNVPLSPDLGDADDWTPGDAITSTSVAQETAEVVLNQSKKKTISLTGKELSLPAYNLIQDYGVPMAKSLLQAVNKSIYAEMLKSKYFVDGITAFGEDQIIDCGTLLSSNEVSMMDRKFVGSHSAIGAFKKLDVLQKVNESGTNDIMTNGMIDRRFGFDFYENTSMATYTPVDVAGAVDKVGGYAIGATTMVVDGFNDDAMPIRAGDIFKVVGCTAYHTVLSTTTTGSDTTGITFYPGLTGAVADDAVITITPSNSCLAFHSSGVALAARAYAVLPANTGVNSTITNFNGLPIRISIWHDAKLGVNVQYDVLYGVKLVNDKKVVKLVNVK